MKGEELFKLLLWFIRQDYPRSTETDNALTQVYNLGKKPSRKINRVVPPEYYSGIIIIQVYNSKGHLSA